MSWRMLVYQKKAVFRHSHATNHKTKGEKKNYRFNKFFIHRLRPLAQITAAAAAAAAALND